MERGQFLSCTNNRNDKGPLLRNSEIENYLAEIAKKGPSINKAEIYLIHPKTWLPIVSGYCRPN